MTTIFDPAGNPVSKPPNRLMPIWIHLRAHWSKWLSILAFVVAIWSATTSHMARVQARSLAKLDFRPDVRVKAWFQDVAGLPPHLRLTNNGPVEAVQVSANVLSRRYYPSAKQIAVTVGGSVNKAHFAKIEPNQTEVFAFERGWLDTNARLHEPPHHNIMELRLEYRRPQDLQIYGVSAIYFVNPDGKWVPETDNSVQTPSYNELREAVLSHRLTMPKRFSLPRAEEGDLLHEDKNP